MGLFHKKSDPISDRSKALNAQIASLEAEIKRLDSTLQKGGNQPKVRSTALPQHQPLAVPRSRSLGPKEPVFESLERHPLVPVPEEADTPDHYNDLGVRKYDLAAAWRRWRGQFHKPPARNPKLISYLAAGSIKGLRPLRYEKRVARNRFIALLVILVCLLWGIIAVFVRSS